MLSQQITALIDKELKKYPAEQRQSAVMAALRFVQDEKGWIAPEDMADIAVYLGMPQMAVYEVATFYHMYNLKPMGKYTLTVCTNLSCTLCGAGDTVFAALAVGMFTEKSLRAACRAAMGAAGRQVANVRVAAVA